MSWSPVAIGSLGQVVTGKTPETKSRELYDGDYPFITPSDIEYRHYVCTQTETTVSDRARDRLPNQFIPPGAVSVTCIGNTIGKIAIAERVSLTNQQMNSIVVDEGRHDPKFIYYLMCHNEKQIRAVGLGGGAATPIINKSTFCSLQVRVPSARENEVAIAQILSGYDDFIANNKRRIELLEQSARLLYKEWFVHLRYPGHEHDKIVDGVPEGWQKIPLGELLTLQRGFDLPTGNRKEGNVPVLASTGTVGFHSEAKVAGPGVVTGRSGSLGTVLFVDEDFWPLNTTLWVKEFKRAGPYFAKHLLECLSLAQFNGGAAVPTLNRNDVHRLLVMSPPRELHDEFEDVATNLLAQKSILERTNEKLAATRDLLLPRLMDGRLSV